jgi:hypothetical protein
VDDLVVLRSVATEPEAEIVSSLLREEGIQSMARPTNFAAGIGDGYAIGGPREILVRAEDEDRARELLERRLPAV